MRESILVLAILPAILLGAFFLWLGAATETEVSPIPSLGADDAFRHVRVVGSVTNVRYTEGEYGHFGVLGVWVREGDSANAASGTLKIKAEGPVVGEMIRNDALPSLGDVIDAEGTLYAGENYRLLNLNSARLLKIREKGTAYESRTVSDLVADPESHGEKSVILKNVVVVDVQGPGKFLVADRGSPRRSVLVYGAWIDRLRKGDGVTIRGLFTYYKRGRVWEIKMRRASSDMVIPGGE
ncbi:MAG: hypothetical protein ACYTHM_22020 [Planctomycetota bacterium]